MGIIGITGGIACGKSTATAYLKRYIPYVTDGDEITARLYGPQSILGEELTAVFDKDLIINPDGSINKKNLGNIVFNDKQSLEKLNGIIQPVIRKKITLSLNRYDRFPSKHQLLDLALMFEYGYDKLCDEVWVIDTPDEIRIGRLCRRNHIAPEEATKIINNQISRKERLDRADVIIDNSRSLHNTENQLRKAYRNFCKNNY